ncbi:hypothetical protein [Methylotuvimicrobium alcaliphilum]|nr:hypothetical protein [Methylotuvimicrobium alcaliphilum]
MSAQIVQVAVGNAGQSLETRNTKDRVHPFAKFAGGWARQRIVEGVGFGQQTDVRVGVKLPERLGRSAAAIFDAACLGLLP